MIRYHCDGCGKDIPQDALRYTVTIDIKAAYDKKEIGLVELIQNHRQAILDLIEQMEEQSVDEVESSVYKRIKLDLCPICQRGYIKHPLHFHPEKLPPDSDLDIDTFLRSLDKPKPE